MYYVRYPLSFRQVEDILHERGIDICHEAVRFWVNVRARNPQEQGRAPLQVPLPACGVINAARSGQVKEG